MAMNHLSQEHPQVWPWGMAMYTNLHYHHHCEREHLFEKPLTPSDVGKLNRLVIPKQHAERYFPLGGDSGEKGLILSFEDEAGKPWRFRYSYWTSSQSYVLTKGWSRYVKEKHLDAGDVVHFERMRGLGIGDRLFIGFRRRGESATAAVAPPPAVRVAAAAQNAGEQQPWSPMCYSTSGSYPNSPANSYAYRPSVDHDHSTTPHAGESSAASGPSRRLRLFGVNLDCGPEPEAETPNAMYGYMHQSPYASTFPEPNSWSALWKKGRKWRNPLFPGQSSFHPRSDFCCFFFFAPSSRNPAHFTGSGSRHALWEVSGSIKVERERQAEMCVRMCHLYPAWVQEQTVRLMYPVLPPEETKQYPHGDFVLYSPSPLCLLQLSSLFMQSIGGAMLSLHATQCFDEKGRAGSAKPMYSTFSMGTREAVLILRYYGRKSLIC